MVPLFLALTIKIGVEIMKDSYLNFSHSSFGKKLFSILGLTIPPELTRYRQYDPLVKDSIILSSPNNRMLFDECFPESKLTINEESSDLAGGLIFDATDIKTPSQLNDCYEFFTQQLKQLSNNGKILIVGLTITPKMSTLQACAQRALMGLVKSLAKEVGRKGVTANLIYTSRLSATSLAASSRFLLSNKSAFISGQIINTTDNAFVMQSWDKPLQGKTALVTGASRGIGAAIAKALARDGATVIGLDRPQEEDALLQQMANINGQSLLLDITDNGAAEKISNALTAPLDILIHNAGITRDKTIKRMSKEQWQSVIDINLISVAKINEYFFTNDRFSSQAKIVCVSSISGIAGNVGQVNYAASKAGIIGLVESTALQLKNKGENITINAVAPGFIETEMTAKIPLITRNLGRRMCSLSQGGLPDDVAQAIAFLSSPNAQNVSGNTIRVCGQSIIGT